MEESIEQELLGTPFQQTRAKLTQDGKIKTGINQLSIQRIFPINPTAHGLGRLAIRQAFNVLHNRHQRYAPRRFGRLSSLGK